MKYESPTGRRSTRRASHITTYAGVLAAALGATAGCGSGATPPMVDCNAVEVVPTYSQITMWPTCTSCHSSTLSGSARHGAPSGVNYDTYEAAVAAAASGAAQVNGGSMPPSSDPQPTAAEREALFAWALCGTPQ